MNTWRTGRSVGRTLYVDDQLVGLVDTAELASAIAEAMNGAAELAYRRSVAVPGGHCKRCERLPAVENERDAALLKLQLLRNAIADEVEAMTEYNQSAYDQMQARRIANAIRSKAYAK